MKLVGVGDGSYERDGNRIEGYRFYFTYDSDKIVGMGVYSTWCNKRVGEEFLSDYDRPEQVIGQEFELVYNRWGKVSGFRLVEVAAVSRK